VVRIIWRAPISAGKPEIAFAIAQTKVEICIRQPLRRSVTGHLTFGKIAFGDFDEACACRKPEIVVMIGKRVVHFAKLRLP